MPISRQAWQDWETELSNLDRLSSKIGNRAFKLWQKTRNTKLRNTTRDYLEWRKAIPDLLNSMRKRGKGITVPPTNEEIQQMESLREDLTKWTRLFKKMGVFEGGITPTIPKHVKPPKSALEKLIWGGLILGGIFGVAALVRELSGGVKAVKGTSENVKDTVSIVQDMRDEPQQQLKSPGYIVMQ